MVIQRQISKADYAIAGVITVLIFLLGIALGVVIDNARYRSSDIENRRQELEYNSLQFQSLYLSKLEQEKACPVLQAALQSAISDLSESLEKVTNKESNSVELAYLTRKYLLDNLRYWLLAGESKKLCGLSIVSVLYFYSDSCDDCPEQGVLLTYYKNVYGDRLLVFPIDIGVDEPMIRILQSQYNLTSYPALVVEGVKYEGILGKEMLGEALCHEFKEC
ncbi:hypothetical protein HY486_00235 [Candidatus Woesearchaeota archaeon]|nr:hypothetical protein [Candidatus Woesearchaeota archaeon]